MFRLDHIFVMWKQKLNGGKWALGHRSWCNSHVLQYDDLNDSSHDGAQVGADVLNSLDVIILSATVHLSVFFLFLLA